MSIEQIAVQLMGAMLSNPGVFDAFEDRENMVRDLTAGAITYAKELKSQLKENDVVDVDFEIINE